MPNVHHRVLPKLTSVAAQLFVRDIETATDYFTSKLGFTLDFVYGEPAFYGQVSRDNVRLLLRHVDEPVFAGDIREREELLSASITLERPEELEQLFRAYEAAHVVFHQHLKREPWGATTFVVSDPDGNLILFAAPSK
jgi:catechol 2,3-dioxygenase-like lactoylglutathione lyase family enzyme